MATVSGDTPKNLLERSSGGVAVCFVRAAGSSIDIPVDDHFAPSIAEHLGKGQIQPMAEIQGVILELFFRHHDSLEQRIAAMLDAALKPILTALQELKHMSQTLSQQLDAATQAIRDDVAAVSAEVTALLAEVTPGSTITQAQVDALTAIDASLKAIPPATPVTPPTTP